MEVRDDEVRVGHLLVERDRDEHDPGEPADHEEHDEADDEEQRRWNRGRPVKIVDDHANTWIVDGITTIAVAPAKKTSVVVGIPVANMWCAQTPKPMKTTSSSAIATSGNAIIFRCVNAGMISVAIPNAGTIRM